MSTNAELSPGTQFVSSKATRTGVVRSVLGAGGQGTVYAVDLEGATFALKWYHEHYIDIDTGLRDRLANAVERGAPDGRFLWPLELVTIPGNPSFGYIMPVRAGHYVGMRDLIAPPPKRVELSLADRAKLCARIADSFLQLHARGFCYQDINFGNIFLDPATADILICDNDNVNVDGAPASIYGTRKFMAPEVVRREVLPSTQTDLFSMAVMFFYVIFGWHPLDGQQEANIKILDTDAENRLYGTQPVFIFDTVNNANAPVAGLHDALVYRWQSLNDELRDLFLQSFMQGLFNPGKRVLEYEWRSAFLKMSSAVYQCGQCGYENVAQSGGAAKCGYCGQDPAVPPLLKVDKNILTLDVSRPITSSMLSLMIEQPDPVVATVEAHPQHAHVLGLRNQSAETWRSEIPGYSATPIAPGKTLRLLHGSRIETAGGLLEVINPGDTPA